jgi:transcriptional regulator with XRE-family HTH domain
LYAKGSNILPSLADRAFLQHVATNVRSRRLAAGLSQKRLAQASGVSLRMIGAIEAGATSVSTATLDRIGIVFDATLAELVTDPSLAKSAVVDRRGWSGSNGGHGTLRWSLDARREVDAWEWRLEPGERYEASADPATWRVTIFVVEGTLTIEYPDGREQVTADGLLLDNGKDHAFVNEGSKPVRFFRCTSW